MSAHERASSAVVKASVAAQAKVKAELELEAQTALEASKCRQASDRQFSADALTTCGISFTSKHDGSHLVVTAFGNTFDFWPGTGIWQRRGSSNRRRGLVNLTNTIKQLKEQADK